MNKQNTEPLVSICCLTYNHEPYIAQAIESFLMQKTNFPIEILIHDDASTDGTEEVVKEYEVKYPKIIKPLYEKENQWSKGHQGSAIFNFPRARGKYIALCEGDDYWTDPYKLQKQVDFLETNPEYSISFHAAEHLNMDTGLKVIHKYKCENGFRSFTTKDAILGGGGFMTTNSMVFRTKFVKNLPEWYYKSPVNDYPLSLILSCHGKIAYFNDIMSVYRKGVEGSWSKRMHGINVIRKLHNDIEKMLFSFNKYTNNKYIVFIIHKIFKDKFLFPIIFLIPGILRLISPTLEKNIRKFYRKLRNKTKKN